MTKKSKITGECQPYRKNASLIMEKYRWRGDKVLPDKTQRNAIVVTDVGQNQMVGARYFNFKTEKRTGNLFE